MFYYSPSTGISGGHEVVWRGQHPSCNRGTEALIGEGDLERAIAEGFSLHANSVDYSTRFWNKVKFPSAIANGRPYWEMPVYSNGMSYGFNEFDPGTDRVVFDSCGRLCTVVRNRGHTENEFHDCWPFRGLTESG